MKERILSIMHEEGISSSRRFAEIIGVQPSTISHILSGRNNPGYDFIVKLLEEFPRINPDWLLRGAGTMYRDDSAASDANTAERDNKILLEEELSVQSGASLATSSTVYADNNASNDDISNDGNFQRLTSTNCAAESCDSVSSQSSISNDGNQHGDSRPIDRACQVEPEPKPEHELMPKAVDIKNDQPGMVSNTALPSNIVILYDDNTFTIFKAR